MNKMIEKGKESANSTARILKKGILSFVQLPPSPSPYDKPEKKNRQGLNGTELFSLFTADIIKEEVVFTR